MNYSFMIRVKQRFEKIKLGLEDGIIYKINIMHEHGASGKYFPINYDELRSVEDIFAIKNDLIHNGVDSGIANAAMYNVILKLRPSDINAYDVFMSNLSGNEINKGVK